MFKLPKGEERDKERGTLTKTVLPKYKNRKYPRKTDRGAPVAGRHTDFYDIFLRGLGYGSAVEHLPVCIKTWGQSPAKL